MNLKEFIKIERLSCERMAREIGISANYLREIRKKTIIPSARLAKDIVAYTKGKVSFSEIMQKRQKNE